MFVYAIRDWSLDGSHIGSVLNVLLTREDADRFIAEVRKDDAALAAPLRVEQIELSAADYPGSDTR